MKRTKVLCSIIIYFILFPLSVQSLRAEELSVTALRSGDIASFDVMLRQFPRDEIVSSFERGYRSTVTFTLQIYRVNSGFFSFFGDRIVAERSIKRTAGWDQFEEIYFISGERGARMKFYEEAGFFNRLFSLDDVIIEIPDSEQQELYALVQVSIEPVRLIPPLTIIRLLNKRNTIQSGWTRVEL